MKKQVIVSRGKGWGYNEDVVFFPKNANLAFRKAGALMLGWLMIGYDRRSGYWASQAAKHKALGTMKYNAFRRVHGTSIKPGTTTLIEIQEIKK